MRSNKDFIEIHGLRTRNVQLINKRAIIFVIKNTDEDQKAIIRIADNERVYKIECEETYKEVAEELLWNGSYEEKDIVEAMFGSILSNTGEPKGET